MKKRSRLLGILTTFLIVLGVFSVVRVLNELTHPAAGAGFPVRHLISAVAWFLLAWLVSRWRSRGSAPEIPAGEEALALQKAIGLPYKFLSEKVPPDTLLRFFKRTLKEAAEQGFSPVLVPVDPAWEEALRSRSPETPEALLSQLPEDGKAVLERRWEAFCSHLPAETGAPAGGDEIHQFVSCKDPVTGSPRDVLLLRAPTGEPWQLPAYVPAEEGVSRPEPRELLAVCRYWYETYRAVPAVIFRDGMEFLLPRTIPKEIAGAVAREHCAFCPGRLKDEGGPSTVEALADSLWKSNIWYFRWE